MKVNAFVTQRDKMGYESLFNLVICDHVIDHVTNHVTILVARSPTLSACSTLHVIVC